MMDKTKFPYEIGTRVSVKNPNVKKLATIVGLSYNSCACMQYEIKFDGEDVVIHYPTDLLTPVTEKQEPMEEKPFECIDFVKYPPNTNKLEIILGDYEIKEENGKYYAVKKNPKYPKTYEECCDILNEYSAQPNITGYKYELLDNFRKLLICRDAYWKLAGEEMGLGKPWKPNWNDLCDKHTIYTVYGDEVWRDIGQTVNTILTFPTEEMRDAFYENFKDLVEECKELL